MTTSVSYDRTMAVRLARARGVCRICGRSVGVPTYGLQENWPFKFGEMTYPMKLTLNFGDEFAHTDCLKSSETS